MTGLGALTAAGSGAAALWRAVLAGLSSAQWREPETSHRPRQPVCVAPEPELSPPELRRLRRTDRSVRLAGAAAWEAWLDAGLDQRRPPPKRVAIFVGTSRGPLGAVIDSHAAVAGAKPLRPSFATNTTICSLSGALSAAFAARGPCLTISSACASGAAALALAAQQIRAGIVDVAIAGGAEAPLHDLVLAQLQSAGVLASHPEPRFSCRPFDSKRNGTVLGEGAAFVVLESLASAQRRGVRARAHFAGCAIGSEAGERTGISDESECLQRTMREALAMAGLSAAELDYINAHGTGTELNDRMEAYAINQVAGADRPIPTSSTKAVVGHCMGAAAAIEAIISILALEQQTLQPSANCCEPAADCPRDLVVRRPRATAVRAVLSNSSGFWGNNGSLLFTRATAAQS